MAKLLNGITADTVTIGTTETIETIETITPMPEKELYIEALHKTKDWKNYLLANSNLPGPRGNLELMQAFVEVGNEMDFISLLDYTPDKAPENTPEGFLAFCGTVGLGKLICEGRTEYYPTLKELASDPRWRMREAVAWALQIAGRKDFSQLLKSTESWIHGTLLEKRALAAGLCEPDLLTDPSNVEKVIAILNLITLSILYVDNRKSENFRILRKGLGYCWSVAIAANPGYGKTVFEKLLDINDPDIRWIIKENLKKKRLIKMDPEWVNFFLNKFV